MNTDDLSSPGYKETLSKVASILDDLKSLDVELLERILSMIGMTRDMFPSHMVPVVKAMETDLKLAVIFANQAKKYDHTDDLLKNYSELFKKGGPDEPGP